MNVHSPISDLCAEGPGLITIEDACAAAAAYATPISAVDEVPVREAVGRTLAEEIVARLAMPLFDQSAMDGYAVALAAACCPPAPASQFKAASPPGIRPACSRTGPRHASSRAPRSPPRLTPC